MGGAEQGDRETEKNLHICHLKGPLQASRLGSWNAMHAAVSQHELRAAAYCRKSLDLWPAWLAPGDPKLPRPKGPDKCHPYA